MTLPTTLDATDRLADLVRRNDPTLDEVPMPPDGKFQTRATTLDALTRETADVLAHGFRNRADADFPTLYCGWGRCRVGSTPLNNLFGLAGIPSYYQPLKNMLRHLLVDHPAAPWELPLAEHQPQIFSKETSGPYVLAEALFLPVEVLVMAGYPIDRLHLIVLDRDPASSLASWLDKWSERVAPDRLVQNYVLASLNKLRVEHFAARHGIPVTHFVYEASKEAAGTVRSLFDRLGLSSRFAESAVTAWNERGLIESESSGVTFPSEPSVYQLPGLHGADTAYKYRARHTAALTDAQLNVLERYGLTELYRASVRACARDLALDEATSKRVFGANIEVAA
ncbi:sulfotransferase family protein [Bradyrhizobium oligotrophicum]|uniref:sulfotransferase family protein n=1 Tax=Bradyrhizobium oligotrophicum TaxID=44255 RepID=UPI003EBBF3E8